MLKKEHVDVGAVNSRSWRLEHRRLEHIGGWNREAVGT